MCRLVVSCRGTLWLATGLVALVLQLCGVLSPVWLVAPPGTTDRRSAGVYSRCSKLSEDLSRCSSLFLDGFDTDPSLYPDAWKAALFFLALCASIQCATLVAGALSCCVQAACGKSVISLTGATQALAGVFGVIGFLLYPWGWGSQRVATLCGGTPQPFLPADCSIGWGLYASAIGIALTFASSGLSRPADRAADTDKLHHYVDRGNHLVCIA